MANYALTQPSPWTSVQLLSDARQERAGIAALMGK